jgi:hypothetical protein
MESGWLMVEAPGTGFYKENALPISEIVIYFALPSGYYYY